MTAIAHGLVAALIALEVVAAMNAVSAEGPALYVTIADAL